MTSVETFSFQLKGQTCVHIDWANVYGWGENVSPQKLALYLQKYEQIQAIHFYYGLDKHPKSYEFLEEIKKIQFNLHTKLVKYITVSKKPLVLKRKCDFDIEITIATLSQIQQFQSYIFFSGDGDFEPLYQKLIDERKQVIVVYARNHLGKEIWDMKKGIFKVEITKLFSL